MDFDFTAASGFAGALAGALLRAGFAGALAVDFTAAACFDDNVEPMGFAGFFGVVAFTAGFLVSFLLTFLDFAADFLVAAIVTGDFASNFRWAFNFVTDFAAGFILDLSTDFDFVFVFVRGFADVVFKATALEATLAATFWTILEVTERSVRTTEFGLEVFDFALIFAFVLAIVAPKI